MPPVLPDRYLCFVREVVAGCETRAAVIRRAELTIAIVPDRQWEEGQLIVSPLRHAPTLLDLTDAKAHAVIVEGRTPAAALMRVYDPDGITIYQNNGVASRQEVPHFHMHVVPRRHGGGWGEGPPQIAGLEQANRERTTEIGVPSTILQRTAGRIHGGL